MEDGDTSFSFEDAVAAVLHSLQQFREMLAAPYLFPGSKQEFIWWNTQYLI